LTIPPFDLTIGEALKIIAKVQKLQGSGKFWCHLSWNVVRWLQHACDLCMYAHGCWNSARSLVCVCVRARARMCVCVCADAAMIISFLCECVSVCRCCNGVWLLEDTVMVLVYLCLYIWMLRFRLVDCVCKRML
jgi:hypothetical protein